jgi:iron complex transport system ATP-binding protein
MTAVPMTQLVMARVCMRNLWMECFATIGVTNAVCAGEWPVMHARQTRREHPGTINLILITNGSLSHAAMVGAVQVATEAKTSLLRDHAVPSCHSGTAATGTGTDAVVIACRLRGQGPLYAYSGTHTIIGALIGRVVADCVARGLAKAKKWQQTCR